MEKLTDHIPDVWFDFYARLLPGTYVALIVFYSPLRIHAPEKRGVLLLLFAAYIVGYMLQPIGSFLSRSIEKLSITETERTRYYQIEQNADNLSRGMLLVQKAWSESVCFSSFSVGSVFSALYIKYKKPESEICWLTLATIAFIVFSIDRIAVKKGRMEAIKKGT